MEQQEDVVQGRQGHMKTRLWAGKVSGGRGGRGRDGREGMSKAGRPEDGGERCLRRAGSPWVLTSVEVLFSLSKFGGLVEV